MRTLAAALSATWAMEESALRSLLDVASRQNDITPEALEAYKAQSLDKAEQATMRDGVAILSVSGPLFKRANLMTAYCGASSYDVLRRDLQAALDDPSVRAILLNVDSPGGEVAGAAELASAVFDARGQKPIVAYAGDLMASAAYWIGSAADKVIVGKSASVGSIGVRASIMTQRDAAGAQRFDFVSSQSPHKVSDPATDDGAARIQARVDALASLFVDAVAANRDVSPAKVLDAFGKGDTMLGEAALAAGMVDAIGTFEATISALTNGADPFSVIGNSAAIPGGALQRVAVAMPITQEQLDAAVAAARAEERAAAEAAIRAAAQEGSETAAAAAQAAERERVAGINAATVGAFASYAAERDEAIRAGSSVAEFKATLVNKEHAKGAARASAVSADIAAVAVPAAPAAPAANVTEDEKAAALLIGALSGFKK